MRNRSLSLPALVLALAIGLPLAAQSRKDLSLTFVDTEGGQSTLIVTPTGESMLVDAGWPGNDGRDAKRIVAAAEAAGVKQIDYLLVTHYHLDHVGGVGDLIARFPVKNVIDHGDNTETDSGGQRMSAIYQKALTTARRITVKPGDVLPLTGVRVEIVAARGACIDKPLAAGGAANPLCASIMKKADDPSENARSIGFVLTYGNFRFVDLGDLTWNKELDLACPVNKLGKVDLYLTTHHGFDASGPAAIVHALAPRVAIMNNGARKGGSPSAWKVVSASPGLEDLWQLHTSVAGGKDANVPEERIANTDEKCQGIAITAVAQKDGTFTVTNLRNGATKTYRKK
jgi:competence protein ComEC